jgi:hypothetical protein
LVFEEKTLFFPLPREGGGENGLLFLGGVFSPAPWAGKNFFFPRVNLKEILSGPKGQNFLGGGGGFPGAQKGGKFWNKGVYFLEISPRF